jgi:hypothetical protein
MRARAPPCSRAVTLEPGNREYLCRLAKQWSDLTYEDGATVEAIQEVNAKAIEYAERVIAMAPAAPDGYMASCVSRGRLALFSDNKAKARARARVCVDRVCLEQGCAERGCLERVCFYVVRG